MGTSIQEYQPTEAALAELAGRYKGVLFEVSTPAGMTAARKARAELKGYRVALEKKRVEIKAPALERVQFVDSEARRIKNAIAELEDPIDAQIQKEEDRRVREQTAALRAEAERVAAEERAKKEAEEKVLAAQRAEIERQREELAAKTRAQAEAEAEARRKIEEAERASRTKIEAEERAARAIREEADRQARLAQQARDEVARVKAQEEEKRLKAERDAREEKQREILRQKNELLDARQMLATFVQRFGHRGEFSPLVKWINQYLTQGRKAA